MQVRSVLLITMLYGGGENLRPTLGPKDKSTITGSENGIGHKNNVQILVAVKSVRVSGRQRLQTGQREWGRPWDVLAGIWGFLCGI